MKDVNSITICRDEFKNKDEFANAVKDAVMCLLTNNYIMTVGWSDKGLGHVVVNFNYDNQEYGCDYPYWLSEDEVFSVITDEEREKQRKTEEEKECY